MIDQKEEEFKQKSESRNEIFFNIANIVKKNYGEYNEEDQKTLLKIFNLIPVLDHIHKGSRMKARINR